MKQSSPAVKKAKAYLQGMLDGSTWLPGDLLPSIKMLALAANVSSVPMWKAVNELADEDVLEVVQGSGTRVKKSPEAHVFTIRNGWLGIRDRIHKDILSGLYLQGSLLPSLKEMRVNYGISYQTLRKALDSLAAEGVIIPEHRTYRAVSYTPQKSHSSVILLGWSHPLLEMQSRTPWGEEFLRECENYCSRIKVNLRIVRYTAPDGTLVFIDQHGVTTTNLKDDTSVLGYLVWAQSPHELYRQVLNQLEKFKKPVSILQEGYQLRLADIVERNRDCKIFSTGIGSSAARSIASYLLEQGHTSIAYFSPFHRSDWSKTRLCGLQEIYNRNGNEANVCQYTLNEYEFTHEFTDSLKIQEIFNKLLPLMNSADIPAMLTKIIDKWQIGISKQLTNEMITMLMCQLFNKAIGDLQCTAWVCASDYVSFMAMDFLKKFSGRKISVVGFDDTFEAFRRGITSYNFNIQGLVQLMLANLLNPGSQSAAKRIKPVEIEGILVVRSSTLKT